MGHVAPVVGYATVHPVTRGPRLYCVACAAEMGVAGEPICGDEPPHNIEPCDMRGNPLASDPSVMVFVPYPERG